MIELRKEFESSSGGFIPPLKYHQVTRSPFFAVYQRFKKDNTPLDFEVIRIQTDPKGKVMKFPGGASKIVEEDTERYPGSSTWGNYGFTCVNLDRALEKFKELGENRTESKANGTLGKRGRKPKERKELKCPPGEFSVKELAIFNSVEYIDASIWIKSKLTSGDIKLIRSENRNKGGRGKPTNIYKKKKKK